jgi:hypothetical protein
MRWARCGSIARVAALFLGLATRAEAAEPVDDDHVQAPPTYDPAVAEPEEATAAPPDPSEARPAGAPGKERVWYGWQTAIVDGAAMSAGAAAVALGVPESTNKLTPAARFGFGWWVTASLAEPVVHFAHHRAGIGLADLGMRIGTSLVGALIGAGVTCAAMSAEDCSRRGAAYGLVGGNTLGAILDAAYLAYDAPSPRPVASGAAWIPAVAAAPGGAVVSVQRAF